jgi:hypothetical protein
VSARVLGTRAQGDIPDFPDEGGVGSRAESQKRADDLVVGLPDLFAVQEEGELGALI